MLILGIESSCDETGVALYDTVSGLLGHSVHSQIALHAEYGGVVPELASRDHVRRLLPMIKALLLEHGRTVRDIEGIAYTEGPGPAWQRDYRDYRRTPKRPLILSHRRQKLLRSPYH